MNEQIQSLLSHFYEYAKDRLGFDRDASIRFVMDEENSKNPLGMTAHYNPDSMEVTVYTTGRHPKDVLRSVAHELVHHKQNCQGKMNDNNPTVAGYAQQDSHLRGLEEEAYLEGNMCFRDWEDTYKANQEVRTIYEGVVKTFTKEKLKMKIKKEVKNLVKEAVLKVLSQGHIREMEDEEEEKDSYMEELETRFPFLREEPKTVQRTAQKPQVSPRLEEIETLISTLGEEKVLELLRQQNELSSGQEEMDLDDDGEIDAEDLAGLRAGKKDRDVGSDKVDEGGESSSHPLYLSAQDALASGGNDEFSQEDAKFFITHLDRMEKMGSGLTSFELDNPRAKEDAIQAGKVYLGGGKETSPESEAGLHFMYKEGDMDEAIEDEIQSDTDRYGDMKHIIPGVRFTGDIETDVRAMEENEELADWLYGELGSGDVITDSEGRVEYAGADVQDYIDRSGVELPDIAETQENFYSQMRRDARTLSEDWNKEFKNKRHALLNERLMKAWKLG